jgi:uracil-DNA glycosylase
LSLWVNGSSRLIGGDPETPVSQLRGKEHHLNGVPMIVTYHPAYLLRKPVEKSKAWRDLCLPKTLCQQTPDASLSRLSGAVSSAVGI